MSSPRLTPPCEHSKGVTADAAWDQLGDSTYFATMLVHTGRVDGMVSGATHTTAQTDPTRTPDHEVRRRRRRWCRARSSCACPTACWSSPTARSTRTRPRSSWREIAISTAETAAAFGIDPVVALISYSTGIFGRGCRGREGAGSRELGGAATSGAPAGWSDPIRRGD